MKEQKKCGSAKVSQSTRQQEDHSNEPHFTLGINYVLHLEGHYANAIQFLGPMVFTINQRQSFFGSMVCIINPRQSFFGKLI